MKKTLYILTALLGVGTVLQAQNRQTIVGDVSVSDMMMERNGAYMAVDMTLDLKKLQVDGNHAVLLTPRLVNGSDSLDLPSVGIYGRRRYYFYVRNGESMLSGKDERSFKASEVFCYCSVIFTTKRLQALKYQCLYFYICSPFKFVIYR